MADRTNLDFNFISLVLSVNGRVRPVDLQQVPVPERAARLQAFFDANAAAQPMHFEGDVLVAGSGAAAAPAPAPVPTPAAAPAPAPAPAAPAPAPAPSPLDDYSAYESVAPAPAPAVAPAPAPAAAPAPAPAPITVPAVTESDFFPVTAEPAAAANPFGEQWAADADADEPAEEPAGKVSPLLWLLPILLVVIGGVIGFLIARPKNRKTATALLTTGIVLTIVYAILAGAALWYLGMIEIPGLPSMAPAPVASQAAAPRQNQSDPPVSAEYAGWTILGRVATTSTALPASAAPDKVRQDTSFSMRSPDGRVTLSAWYARSAPSTSTVAGKKWMNLDEVYRSTPASSALAVSLYTQMKKDHPAETLLGAYRVGTPAAGLQRYNVGYAVKVAKGAATVLAHGEHVYTYSPTAGWTQVALSSKSGSMWAAAGAIK